MPLRMVFISQKKNPRTRAIMAAYEPLMQNAPVQKVLSAKKFYCGAGEPKILLVTEKFFEGVSLQCKNVYTINTNKFNWKNR